MGTVVAASPETERPGGQVLRRSGVVAIMWVMTGCIAGTSVFAQVPLPPEPGRPFGGVFRGSRTEDAREALSVTASVSEAYDNDIIGMEGTGGPSLESGLFSRLSSQLSYVKRKDRLRFVAGGGLGLDFYSKLESDIPQPVETYQGNAGVTFTTRRAVVQATQSISHYPYFGFDLSSVGSPLDLDVSLGESPILRPGPEAALFEDPVVTFGTSASTAVSLGRRSTATFAFSYSGAQESDHWPTADAQSASGQFSQSVSRSLDLNVNYGYQFTNYHNPGFEGYRFSSHELTGGVSWNRTLSRTRSVSVSGSAGQAFFEDAAIGGMRSSHGLTARGAVGFQFARSWTVHSDFNRTLQYVQGLSTPYYGNGFSFGLQGEPTRRLELSANTGVIRSDSISGDGVQSDYHTRNTSIHARYALGRNAAIFGQYGRSYYEFGAGAGLPSGVLRQFDREVIQVGLTFGHLLFRR